MQMNKTATALSNIAADIPLKETFSTKQMPRAVPQASEARVEK